MPKDSEVKPWDCSGLHLQVGQVSRQDVKDGEDLLEHCQLAAHEGNSMTSLLKCYVQKEDENLVLVEPEVDVEEANVDEAPNAEHVRQDTSDQGCKEDCTTEDTIEVHNGVQDASLMQGTTVTHL